LNRSELRVQPPERSEDFLSAWSILCDVAESSGFVKIEEGTHLFEIAGRLFELDDHSSWLVFTLAIVLSSISSGTLVTLGEIGSIVGINKDKLENFIYKDPNASVLFRIDVDNVLMRGEVNSQLRSVDIFAGGVSVNATTDLKVLGSVNPILSSKKSKSNVERQYPTSEERFLARLKLAREGKPWQSMSNCLGVDPELFFPERGASTSEAKEVCRGCIVREDCLEYALANVEMFGIWGGLSERERRKVRRSRALARRAESGN
jgi:WhiB family transcriptional regulator, redox-sensing transcriptional regulator